MILKDRKYSVKKARGFSLKLARRDEKVVLGNHGKRYFGGIHVLVSVVSIKSMPFHT